MAKNKFMNVVNHSGLKNIYLRSNKVKGWVDAPKFVVPYYN